MERVFHAGGESIVNTYLVNILLPNQVVVYSRCVTEGIINGADVLIGMDIIARGDFTLSSKGGKTKFCFQLPSTHDFDFAQEEKDKFHTPFLRDKLPERNDPCHCGSGKKYKNCHGK
ncbi:hypothetical protein EZS27_041067 [termite gut metagenome]|uniref:Protein translocase subunit SecA n=1 Tax=termite gut metagenome TaxID=433724 RepID=A0A5J4PCP6_9ZZZZ